MKIFKHSTIKATILACLLLSVSSCAWFKPAQDDKNEKVYNDDDIGDIQGKKVFDPETGTWRTVRELNEKVDTVRWTELSPERFPPIKTDPNWEGGSPSTGSSGNNNSGNNSGGNTANNSSNRDALNVALLLPFLSQRFDTANIDKDALWAIHFYAGAKLAYDELEADGVKLNISVMDTEASTSKMTSVLRASEVQKADLLIGPYKREQVQQVAEFAKSNKKPLIVPHTAQMGMAMDNPWYIQVNPSLKSHCEAITRHARKRFRTEDIVLVARQKDEEAGRLQYFQDANAAVEGKSAKFREFIVTDETSDYRKMDVSPYVRPGRTTVFIVPSWSNESFIYSLLRQLMVKQSAGEDIIVYGMPQWMDYEQIEYEFYEKLNLHVSSASFTDAYDERVRQFKRAFFDAYGTVPREEAYLGYDVLLYFGKMAGRWGKDFYQNIDRDPFDVLHGRFSFDRIVLEPEKHREDSKYYDQMENTHVNILKFRDFQFSLAD
jgi:hypothetical protein